MRKENIVTLVDGGEEKKFKIKQMSATRGERFLFKLIMLLGGQTQIESLTDPYALIGSISSKPFDKVQELLDELIGCVSRVNGGVETQLTPDNADGFIEESMTLLKLRAEALKLNNFFQNGGQPPLSEFSDISAPTIKRRA